MSTMVHSWNLRYVAMLSYRSHFVILPVGVWIKIHPQVYCSNNTCLDFTWFKLCNHFFLIIHKVLNLCIPIILALIYIFETLWWCFVGVTLVFLIICRLKSYIVLVSDFYMIHTLLSFCMTSVYRWSSKNIKKVLLRYE